MFSIINEDFSKLILKGAPFSAAFFKLICDENNNPVDCELLEGNDKLKEIFTLRRSGCDGRSLSEAVRDKDFLNWMHCFGEVALTGGSKSLEYFSEYLDKWYHLLIYSQKQYYFVTLFFDITEKKQLIKRQEAAYTTDDFLLELDQDYVIRRCSAYDENYKNIQEIALDKPIDGILDRLNTRKIVQALQAAYVSQKCQYVELHVDNVYEKKCYWIKVACLEEGAGINICWP